MHAILIVTLTGQFIAGAGAYSTKLVERHDSYNECVVIRDGFNRRVIRDSDLGVKVTYHHAECYKVPTT